MKSNILVIVFILLSLMGFAQNDMKARMEYEDAEIAYQNGKYSEAISHLETAEKLLGKATGKTRYLLVLALSKGLRENYEYKDLETLRAFITHYLDNYQADAGKYREIYDLFNNMEKSYPGDLATYNKIKQDKKDKEGQLMEQLKLTKRKELEAMMVNMIAVEGGTFNMGSKEEKDEKPIHSVTLSTYSIGKYPVTVREYRNFCDETGRKLPEAPKWGWKETHPMVNVSWHDAVTYCDWLSQKTGLMWRLPTEAEWEFAARGGNKSQGYLYSGDNDPKTVGLFGKNSKNSTEGVGLKKSNELGIFDMSGNVLEMCQDRYSREYYSDSPKENPKGPTVGQNQVARGGCWRWPASSCRVADRSWVFSYDRSDYVGFRVVLSQ